MLKVAVAMSGGVDSSIAAHVLKAQGYDCFGLTMLLAPRGCSKDCCSLDAAFEAEKIAYKLGIPHYTVDCRAEFAHYVMDNFAAEYLSGRTPNPCIRCNRYLKFAILWDKAARLGAAKLATGHYARIEAETQDAWRLKTALDETKDQSYFLYPLTPEQLSRTVFPLGGKRKAEVRSLAASLDLACARKPESQDICFVPEDKYAEVLRQRYPQAFAPGLVKDTRGKVLGEHKGIAFYTIGQRRGLGISAPEPLYVLSIDAGSREIILGPDTELYRTSFIVREVNWCVQPPPALPLQAEVKIRSNAAPERGQVSTFDINEIKVKFALPQRGITPGQAAVFYHKDMVLGGGVIDRVLNP